MPKVVHDEVEHHIKKYLESQRNSLKVNPYKFLLNISDGDIDDISINTHIEKIIKEENIEYEVVTLKDEISAYKKAYKHAIEGLPPFEPEKDKGFKDTLIACTIDQYCQKIAAHDFVFFLTADDQLKKYYKNNRKVHIISSYEEFDVEYGSLEITDSLSERLKNFISEDGIDFYGNVQTDDHWFNYEGDLVVKIHVENIDGIFYYVLVDPVRKEPVSYTSTEVQEIVSSLAMADTIKWAKEVAIDFSEIVSYLSVGGLLNVYNAFRNNEDLWLAVGDISIRQAAFDLYQALQNFSMKDEAYNIKEKYL